MAILVAALRVQIRAATDTRPAGRWRAAAAALPALAARNGGASARGRRKEITRSGLSRWPGATS